MCTVLEVYIYSLLTKKIRSYGNLREIWKHKKQNHIATQTILTLSRNNIPDYISDPNVSKLRVDMLERNMRFCAQLHFNICKEIGAKFEINWQRKQIGTVR